ncbi:fumarylacetoacetate hydrolase family protein [Roseateles koreensis]|uniref:Fumarylacetoacetate hydrolase family protein n=1 Tax=Roseateles koreensis TaxID=2987526 RepID=A0ABT5KPV5_9BURK|nr:fumarylacetoacetate hydrolase family protein [Roseateles koreensis]MDC8784949.1 fumarylacetoacetate hydrolase family protein [Roseateles koreensis]
MTQDPKPLAAHLALAAALARTWGTSQALRAPEWQTAVPDEATAYAVQEALSEQLAWHPLPDATEASAGTPTRLPVRHWKSGGAARDAALSHAPLAPAGVRTSPADFQDLALRLLCVEAEIALRLGTPVTPAQAAALNPAEALQYVDAFAVSAELVASRWQESSSTPALLRQADCLTHGALALGPWQAITPGKLPDWSTLGCWIQRNEAPPVRAQGSHPLGTPAWLVPAWLRHLTRHGATVPAGTVVTTGAWLVVGGIQAGDTLHVGFEGLGEISLRI